MEETLMEERKQMLLTLMKDPTYVPMKLKELAMLLGVPKEQRKDLEEVLNEGKVREIRGVCADGDLFSASQRLWICDDRGTRRRSLCPAG